jgi:hypothetical protein
LGSIDRRIQLLEEHMKSTTSKEWNPQRDAIIAELEELEANHGPLRERAEREAAEGRPERLRALEDLEEQEREWRERCQED